MSACEYPKAFIVRSEAGRDMDEDLFRETIPRYIGERVAKTQAVERMH
jgi:hypothetical protein